MKKVVFISVLLIGLMCTFKYNISADDGIDNMANLVWNSSTTYYIGVLSDAKLNTTTFQVTINNQSYDFIKPVCVVSNGNLYSIAYADDTQGSSNKGVIVSLYSDFSSPMYQGHSYLSTTSVERIEYFSIPCFNNPEDASNYSCGNSYNQGNIVGGDIPFQIPSIGSEYYENHIYHFEKVWNVYSRPTTRMSWNIAWLQPYGNDLYESSDFHRQIGITLRYPDYTSIANLYDSVFNEPQSFSTTLEYAKSFFNYDNLYDSRLTYKTTTVWIDIDDMINDYEANGENSEWANWFHLTQNTDKNEYNFTMYETLETAFTANNWGQSYSYNPKGIINILRQYYNNDRLLLFALPFCIFDKAQMFTFNEPLNIVYNPIYIFWFDVTAPDGTRSEKRNFGSPTDISSDNLVEPDSTNGNVGVENGVPNPTQEQLNSNYNNSIQDSYNTIYNNYYYTSQENKELLDYLLKYKNGGTQEEIQDAFGYVNSTVDSVSNVPVLLGKLFMGFFPAFVVKLFSAMFIIFGVFIVIKIIRHLFL